MSLTAVFVHWHLDENYPALSVGDQARLSFELTAYSVAPVTDSAPDDVRQFHDAEYEITGQVIGRYAEKYGKPFPVLQADWFRFYCQSKSAANLQIHARARLRGCLELDSYLWVENVREWRDPPQLFYNVRIARIRRVRIPERFVARKPGSLAYPSWVGASDYGPKDIEEIACLAECDFPWFALLDFDLLPAGEGPVIPSFICRDV